MSDRNNFIDMIVDYRKKHPRKENSNALDTKNRNNKRSVRKRKDAIRFI